MLPARDLLDLLSDLSRRLGDDHSLDALARRSGWSKFHLQRNFQRATRETPKQYVTRLRVQVAAALLAATSDRVSSIAACVGFSSHEVFVRAFRRTFGCTPSRYRSQHAFRHRSYQQASSRGKATGPGASGADHVRLVRSVAPCVGLFRTPIHHPQEPPPMSSVTVKLETLEAQPVLFIQRRVANTQLATLFFYWPVTRTG